MGVYIKRYTSMDKKPSDCSKCCYYKKLDDMSETCTQERKNVSTYVSKKYCPSWCPLSEDRNQLDDYGSWR